MNQKSVLSIALALLLASTGSSFAQGNSQHQRNGNNGNHGKNDCRDGNCDGPDQRHRPSLNARQPSRPFYQDRVEQQRGYQQRPDQRPNFSRGERGAGPNQSFYRGDRLPPQYRGQQYVVSDWRGHHLNAPPRGYHWVQSGGDYILVAIATGVILQLLLNN